MRTHAQAVVIGGGVIGCSWLYWGYFSRENFVLVAIASAASTLNLLLG